MEKLIKFLFVGTSVLRISKTTAWLLLTLLVVALLENGGNDGQITRASVFALIFGLVLTLLSLALSRHYARLQRQKAEAFVKSLKQPAR